MSTTKKRTRASRRAAPPCSALDGYRAAAIHTIRALDAARKERPRRRTLKMTKTAAYREGYYSGLLTAHCQHALGEYPEVNASVIRATLAPNKEVSIER